MKCSIITIHHIHNFGSVLQAYSLQKFLQQNGYDTQIIDYRPAYYNAGRNKLKTLMGKALNLSSYRKRKQKFDRFVKSYVNLSSKCFHTLEDLRAHYSVEDALYIAGGDQLWNNYHPCGNDDAYKLTFTNKGRKLAYGTSMGRDHFTAEELASIAEKTADFEAIFLREKVTVDLLAEYTSVPVRHVIDPVGLLEPADFEAIAKKPDMKGPYAVMYLADSSPLLDSAIDILSQKMGLKIVHICGFRKKCYCDRFEKDVGPEEILGYIRYADFVLSASFHATMFSLLFQKPFASLLPGEKTNARIEDVLRFVGQEKRIIRNTEDLAVLQAPVDYTQTGKCLKQWKDVSAQMLLDALAFNEEG